LLPGGATTAPALTFSPRKIVYGFWFLSVTCVLGQLAAAAGSANATEAPIVWIAGLNVFVLSVIAPPLRTGTATFTSAINAPSAAAAGANLRLALMRPPFDHHKPDFNFEIPIQTRTGAGQFTNTNFLPEFESKGF